MLPDIGLFLFFVVCAVFPVIAIRRWLPANAVPESDVPREWPTVTTERFPRPTYVPPPAHSSSNGPTTTTVAVERDRDPDPLSTLAEIALIDSLIQPTDYGTSYQNDVSTPATDISLPDPTTDSSSFFDGGSSGGGGGGTDW